MLAGQRITEVSDALQRMVPIDVMCQQLTRFAHLYFLQISFRAGILLDNICVTYGGGHIVQHGGNGGQGHASLFLSPHEDIVGVAMYDGWLPLVGTCVKDVILVVANRQTQRRRAWSAREEAIDMHCFETSVVEVPGKVLKCFTGRAGWYVDQISCTWHTPMMNSDLCRD